MVPECRFQYPGVEIFKNGGIDSWGLFTGEAIGGSKLFVDGIQSGLIYSRERLLWLMCHETASRVWSKNMQ